MDTNKMLDYEFGKENTYLVAVTYGPDSMALLDMMLKKEVKPVVCYINYHTGEAMESAEQGLRRYCQEKDLILESLDTNFIDQAGRDDDYDAWGRKARYDFFESLYRKYNAAALFIAHQQDDVIESYLTIKEKGIQNAKYGWNKISTYRNMIVVRPLLDYTKEDLLEYDKTNNVPYQPDILHFSHVLSGNALRDRILQMTEIERGQIIDEMAKANSDKNTFIASIDQSISTVDELEIRAILALNEDEFIGTLIDFVNKKSPIHISITAAMASSIRKMCLDRKPNMTLCLKSPIYMVKEYDVIYLDTDGLDMPYSYTLDKPQQFSCPTFDLDFTMGAEDRNIHPEDYPLTVRSVLPQDVYVYGGYLLPVRRMLVAAGVTPRLLHVWPVFLDKDGHIIYVPRYKKGFSEYHTSILNIHVKNDEK